MKVVAYSHHPPSFSRYSGMNPLAYALGAHTILYRASWKVIQDRWWRLGHRIKWWGDAYYGSGWNSLLPHWDERMLAAKTPSGQDIAHFVWAEFASPSRPALFRKKARLLTGTFHASARKLPRVIRSGYRALDYFDGITLMSASQRPFFLERGFPADRMRVILHGVDCRHFHPAEHSPDAGDRPLRGLMVGSTERDHAMMAAVLKALPPGILELTVLTHPEQQALHYHGAPHVRFPGVLSDEALIHLYQQADLLVMPMIDCTANNAVLESMACGTPVMVNRVGGIPEYVTDACAFIMDEHVIDAWVAGLMYCHANPGKLVAMRAAARAQAKAFHWAGVARQYFTFFNEITAR